MKFESFAFSLTAVATVLVVGTILAQWRTVIRIGRDATGI